MPARACSGQYLWRAGSVSGWRLPAIGLLGGIVEGILSAAEPARQPVINPVTVPLIPVIAGAPQQTPIHVGGADKATMPGEIEHNPDSTDGHLQPQGIGRFKHWN